MWAANEVLTAAGGPLITGGAGVDDRPAPAWTVDRPRGRRCLPVTPGARHRDRRRRRPARRAGRRRGRPPRRAADHDVRRPGHRGVKRGDTDGRRPRTHGGAVAPPGNPAGFRRAAGGRPGRGRTPEGGAGGPTACGERLLLPATAADDLAALQGRRPAEPRSRSPPKRRRRTRRWTGWWSSRSPPNRYPAGRGSTPTPSSWPKARRCRRRPKSARSGGLDDARRPR